MSQPLPGFSVSEEKLFHTGIAQFNQAEFFDCHETLEELWKEYHGVERELLQAIIQIAVGYYHHIRGNNPGALKLFKRAYPRLVRYRPFCLGIDVESLSETVSKNIEDLESPSAPMAAQLKIARLERVP